jgi:hypothetical protein
MSPIFKTIWIGSSKFEIFMFKCILDLSYRISVGTLNKHTVHSGKMGALKTTLDKVSLIGTPWHPCSKVKIGRALKE